MESAKKFGKHVSPEKQRLLLAVTLLACAMPVVLGNRLWDQIPEWVLSGLTNQAGKDDSIPRWMVAVGLPALMCLLEGIAHFMLRMYQKQMTLPPRFNRLMGRWSFPVISVLFCGMFILKSAGEPVSLAFAVPCLLGLALLMLGAHLWDCPMDAKVALRFGGLAENRTRWQRVHRVSGCVWMAAGLLILLETMLLGQYGPLLAAAVLAAILVPLIYSKQQSGMCD